MCRYFKITAIQALALFLLSVSSAAQTADTTHIEQLEGAQVLAEAQKEIIPGKTLSREQIRSSWNLAEAIRHFSGLQVKDYGNIGGLKTVNIRSLGSEHTGVYLDGISVDNAQNMQVDLGRFSSDSYDRIEVFNGQRSLRLQSAKEYANSNALYLTTAPPLFPDGTHDHFQFRLKGGAFGTAILTGSWAHQNKKGLRSRINMDLSHAHGRYPFTLSSEQTYPDGSQVRHDTTLTRLNGDLSAGRLEAWLFGERGKIQTYLYASERGLPGPVIRRTLELPTGRDRQTDVNFFVQGSYQLKRMEWGPVPVSILLKGKFSQDYLRYRTQPDIDPGAQPFDNRYHQTALYLSYAQLFALSDRWALNLSVDGQYNYLDANLHDFVYPHRLSLWAAIATSYHGERWKFSASLLYHIFSDRLKKTADGFPLRGQTRQAVSPFLLFSYDILPEQLEIHGFAKNASRMPTFNDLYYTLVGNSDLKPEYTDQVDLGMDGSFPLSPTFSLHSSVDFYANRIKDKIVATPTSNQFRWSMFNIGEVHIQGMDLDMRMDCHPTPSGMKAAATVQYTYQRALDFSHPDEITYRNQIPYIPRHSGSISGDLTYSGWNLGATWFVSSKRWSTSSNLPIYELAAWNTLDIDLCRSFHLKRIPGDDPTLKMSLSFRNILNDQYEIVQGYPMPGFHVLALIEFNF